MTRRGSVIIALLLSLLAWLQWTRWRGAPWQPSTDAQVDAMLRLASVAPGETVVDLGAGDGRLVVAAARDYGAHAVGVEIDAGRAAFARMRIARAGLGDRAVIERGDLFGFDVAGADVVACFLMQWSNEALQEKLVRELRPGARIVTNRWTFPELREVAREGVVRVYEVG